MNIFPPIMSTRSLGQKFTAQGLGDRFHLVSLAYQISRTEKRETTLHLATNHTQDYKLNSFNEILELFPPGNVILEFHPLEFTNNQSWRDYLQEEYSDAQSIGYADHPGWLETNFDVDASSYLQNRFLISPTCDHALDLPEKFVVYQWDSTGSDRRLDKRVIDEIEKKYLELEYEKIVVGGEAVITVLRNCLACASKAISKANFFVGVDSGFMHVAWQVLPTSQIHFYSSANRYWSHHSFRALDSEVKINYFGKNITCLEMLYIRLRYDSPKIARIAHGLKNLKVRGK